MRTDFEAILSARGKCVGKGSDVQRFLVGARGQLTTATKSINAYADLKTWPAWRYLYILVS